MAAPHNAAPPARKVDRVMDVGFRISDFGSSVPAADACGCPRRKPKSVIRNPILSTLFPCLPGHVERNRALAGADTEVDDLVRLGTDHVVVFGKLLEALRTA